MRMHDRIEKVKTVVDQATLLPFTVRAGIAVCFVLAMAVAWPASVVASQYLPALLLVALYPAVAPRGRAGTLAALTVVGGWLLDTSWGDAPVALWRVLTLATLLYLAHTLTALAAVLPFDAMVNVDVASIWLARALGVVLISAVLTVIALGLSSVLAGSPFLIATLIGLAAAVGSTLLLTRLLRRP